MVPLKGKTPEAGWDHEGAPEENLTTLIEVLTDEGASGIGCSYTSQALVDGALKLMRPWLIGESGIEPERVSE